MIFGISQWKVGPGFILAVLLCWCVSAPAQQLPFAHLSISDGLEDTVIFAMEQDRRGFLWIATRTGLNRFDGARFWTYTQADGLPHNLARDLLASRDGRLWAATERGLVWFDGERFQLVTAEQGWPERISARALSQAPDGSLWVASYGAGVLQLQAGSNPRVLQRIDQDAGLPSNRVRSLLVDSGGQVWIGTTDHGVWLLGHDGPRPVDWGAPSQEVRALHETSDGQILAGTRSGVARYADGSFQLLAGDDALSAQAINSISGDRQGRTWFATRENGAFSLDADGGLDQFTTRRGLPDDAVNAVYQDTEGNLWFGTYGGGLSRLSTNRVLNWTPQVNFANPNVYAIAADSQGRCIWLGTNGDGVSSLCGSQLRQYTRADGLPHNKVLSVMVDRSGNPWFGTLEGVSRMFPGGFENLDESDGLAGAVSYHLIEAADGGVWIGTIDGLSHYRDGSFTNYTESDGLPDSRVNRVLERADGGLWLGTANGLAEFHQGQFTVLTTEDGLPSNFINDLYLDGSGALWVATNYGLSRYADGSFQSWTVADGLPHSNCNVILPGSDGTIWVGTSRGLAILDGNGFTVVTSREGLVFDLVNRGAGYRDPDGNLWFGTGQGVSRFAADFRPGPATPPPVHLLSVVGMAGPLPLDQPARIEQRDESLTISYGAISFQRAPDVAYRYRLARDAQTPWRETRLRELQIDSLAPGDYQFEVTARIAGGAWNDQVARFAFTVVPPFWLKPWFLLLGLALLLGALLYRNVRSRRRAEELERLVDERTQQLQELNDGLEWLANHDNLTHLANRNQVEQRLSGLYSGDSGLGLGIVILDLDHFKSINDEFGHAAGDRALEAFARLLHGHVRTDQLAARWGGEEFLMVYPGIEEERLVSVAEQLLESCRGLQVEFEPGRFLELRCSLGFTLTPARGGDWQKLVQLADQALLESKRAGRDRGTGYLWGAETADLDAVVRDVNAAVSSGLLRRVAI